MKVAIVFTLAVTVAFCSALTTVDHSEWAQFKVKHGKSYESTVIENLRKQIYLNNKQTIQRHNERYARNETSYYMAINKFSDMLPVEVAQKLNGLKLSLTSSKPAQHNVFKASGVKLATTVDWRDSNIVTPVKNQEECGGCWAFSTTGSLEGQHALKTKKLVSLSEQNLIDCSSAQGNMGCDGGLMDDAFKYIKKNKGIDTEASYPFTGEDGTCRFKRKKVGATLTGYKDVESESESALQEAVATVGPISVAIDASLASFTSYAGGVYDESSCSSTELDHGVLAVGYGTHNNKDYWLVKNSWGTDWGIDGYIMMSRNKNNQCGIATMASYPIV